MPITFSVADTKPNDSPDRKPFSFKTSREFNETCDQIVVDRSQGACPTMYENGLVGTIEQAYNAHYDLVIRPDDFWTTIVTQFSYYVNKHGEALRDRFVTHQGQKQLVVSDAGSLYTANYENLIVRMTELIEKNLTSETKSWMIPNFSTTTPNDVMVNSIVMMATTKTYFKYAFELCCGIPKVTMLGEVEDWQKLRSLIDNLLRYDINGQIKSWHHELTAVLDNLVSSAKGEPDIGWWSRICDRHGGGSGPRFLSGWIIAFCMFTAKGDLVTRESTGDGYDMVNKNHIPEGIVTVPVIVDDNGTEYKCSLFAGCAALKEVDKTVIQPQSVWCLAVNKPPKQ